MYPKDFSIILGILLVAIWIYLLLIQKISQWGLVGLVLATAILVGILFNIENIGSIGIRTKETEYLVKMREIRDEVYAKAQTVTQMGEEIAKIVAFNISHLGRFPPDNLDHLLLEHRDKLVSMLQSIGSGKETVAKLTQQIDQMVAFDLASNVIRVVDECHVPGIRTPLRPRYPDPPGRSGF